MLQNKKGDSKIGICNITNTNTKYSSNKTSDQATKDKREDVYRKKNQRKVLTDRHNQASRLAPAYRPLANP